MTDTAKVVLWGSDIGAVTWDEVRDIGVFQYMPDFADHGIELSPLQLPLNRAPYEFPSLSRVTFKGLPGMLADSLPDKFGSALIDAWLAARGRPPGSFTPVERLCYTGSRGMGALEFEPAVLGPPSEARKIEIDQLVALANRVLDDRIALEGKLGGEDDRKAIEDLLRVGTSAGGARAKAVLVYNPETGEFRSGQAPTGRGFSHYLIKFDGVSGNRDKELADPLGFGRIEYAYHLMALEAGIEMQECRLHEEGGRAHFMTRRFDRTDDGDKLHAQSLGALMHYDFNLAGAYAYEQAILAIKRLGLSMPTVEEQVRRAFFNILARNQDDHVKNIAFLMDRSGNWRLSPAFDLTYAYNPSGAWTGTHQMTLNGKRDGFHYEDLETFAVTSGLKKAKTRSLFADVAVALEKWPRLAKQAGVPQGQAEAIRSTLRTGIPGA